jgi:hypothetical protein
VALRQVDAGEPALVHGPATPPAPEDPDFETMVRLIHRNGRVRNWHGRPYTYLRVDEWDYWTMGEPVNETVIINRRRTVENDWDPE